MAILLLDGLAAACCNERAFHNATKNRNETVGEGCIFDRLSTRASAAHSYHTLSAMTASYRNLPDVLLVALYSEWLTVFEIARLDSATCNRQQRQTFTALAYKSTRSQQYPSEILGGTILDAMSVWICRKDVPVAGLFLTPTLVLDEQLRLDFLKRRGDQLEWITYTQQIGKPTRGNPSDASLGVETYCPNLTRLRAIDWDGGAAVTKIITSCQHLTELRLKGEITNKQILKLVGKCTNLRKLTIHAIQNRQDGVFNELISSCPHLVEINLRMQENLSNALLDKIVCCCPELTVLKLHNSVLSVRTVLSLLKNCRMLRSLSLLRLEMYDWYEDATASPVFTSNLTDLHLETMIASDEDALFILQHCPALQTLTLQRTMLAAPIFMKIVEQCRQLRRLNIAGNAANVDDAVLYSVGRHCVQLRMLDVTGDTQVSDTGVTTLAWACPLLEELNLPAGSDVITDVSLFALAAHCRGLKQLVLDTNQRITDVGVTALLEGCPMLQLLSVYHCNGLSKEVFA